MHGLTGRSTGLVGNRPTACTDDGGQAGLVHTQAEVRSRVHSPAASTSVHIGPCPLLVHPTTVRRRNGLPVVRSPTQPRIAPSNSPLSTLSDTQVAVPAIKSRPARVWTNGQSVTEAPAPLHPPLLNQNSTCGRVHTRAHNLGLLACSYCFASCTAPSAKGRLTRQVTLAHRHSHSRTPDSTPMTRAFGVRPWK